MKNFILCLPKNITTETTNAFQKEFLEIINNNDPDECSITIIVNSDGGEIYSALGIRDLIEYFNNQGYSIKLINTGCAASMAAFILLSGPKGQRCAFANSTFYFHPVKTKVDGELPYVKKELEESQRLSKLIYQIISQCSKKVADKMIKSDFYMTAQEALDNNLIDRIIK